MPKSYHIFFFLFCCLFLYKQGNIAAVVEQFAAVSFNQTEPQKDKQEDKYPWEREEEESELEVEDEEEKQETYLFSASSYTCGFWDTNIQKNKVVSFWKQLPSKRSRSLPFYLLYCQLRLPFLS